MLLGWIPMSASWLIHINHEVGDFKEFTPIFLLMKQGSGKMETTFGHSTEYSFMEL